MAQIQFQYIFLVAGCSILAAWFSLWLAGFFSSGEKPQDRQIAETDDPVRFLLERGQFSDVSTAAQSLLDELEEVEQDWSAIVALFGVRFPTLPDAFDELRSGENQMFDAGESGDVAQLHLDWVDDTLRVTLTEMGLDPARSHRLFMLERELSALRKIAAEAPNPSWLSNASGRVLWSNTAFDRLIARLTERGSVPAGGVAEMFEISYDDARRKRVRCSISDKDSNRDYWYDVTTQKRGDIWVHFAVDINAVVRAEIAQRNFVQTLAKTFAQLSTGLAIFDRSQQLALFNPALIDLTALPAEFLSARPTLLSFFDLLREKRMMPEPKNYTTWREQMTDLVDKASDGRYSEVWTLPSGLTYRVNGRPHPDGAIAFLFEDISAEISLTRRFRSELELGQSVLDTVDEAMAVFSPSGTLSFTNAAYRKLWDTDPDQGLDDMTLEQALAQWQQACNPTDTWDQVREFMGSFKERQEWHTIVSRHDGSELRGRFVPLPRGATLIAFRPLLGLRSKESAGETTETDHSRAAAV